MHLRIRNISRTCHSIPAGGSGMLGPNRAGKSMLMQEGATVQAPDGGSIRRGELDLPRRMGGPRQTPGCLPQESGLYPKPSAKEPLDRSGLPEGIAGRQERRVPEVAG